MLKNTIFPLLFVSFCLTFVGCGGEPKPDGFPVLYPISLTFTQEEEPCEDAVVQLLSLDNSPWSVAGMTGARGITTFWTHGKFPGAPAGRYRVDIKKEELATAANGDIQVYTLIDPNLTPIEIEVIAGKNSFEPFDLGKKVRVLLKP